jgi:hypothetical protein
MIEWLLAVGAYLNQDPISPNDEVARPAILGVSETGVGGWGSVSDQPKDTGV